MPVVSTLTPRARPRNGHSSRGPKERKLRGRKLSKTKKKKEKDAESKNGGGKKGKVRRSYCGGRSCALWESSQGAV